MIKRPFGVLLALLVALALTPVAAAQPLTVSADDPDGVYDVGQTVRWDVTWAGENPPESVRYTVKAGGLTEVDSGTLTLDADGTASVEAKLEEPGTLLLEVDARAGDSGGARGGDGGTGGGERRNRRAFGGAVAAPEQIPPSSERPADFDAFWDAQIERLQAIPVNPQLTPGDAGKPGVDYWTISLDNTIGTKVQGQLARPTEGEKFPALLIVQWAGVYPLQKNWAVDRAADGWLVLNIMAHDLPISEDQSFYREQSAGPLKDYPAIGNDDRETSYFLRMYLGDYRAAEYLAQRDDWDGRTLVVMGGSQGGQQTLVTAALHPAVTAAMASVPAGCDMLGPAVGRQGGWPMWYWQTGDKDPEQVREASRYFDVVNFAPRIDCPVLVGIGLIDTVCPPAGIFAAVNQIDAPNEVVVLPKGAHNDERGSHKPYNDRLWGAWLPALKAGTAPPLEGQ